MMLEKTARTRLIDADPDVPTFPPEPPHRRPPSKPEPDDTPDIPTDEPKPPPRQDPPAEPDPKPLIAGADDRGRRESKQGGVGHSSD
jgi:hypothetical protein